MITFEGVLGAMWTVMAQGVSCYVLEMFTENLEPETVMPFLEPLMTRLVQMLHTPKKGVKVRWLLFSVFGRFVKTCCYSP